MSRPPLPWIIAIVALAAGLGLWLGVRYAESGGAQQALRNALVYPQPKPVPEFSLTRSDGKAFTPGGLRGRWTLVFFGFTHCPDVCPTTLGTLREVRALLDASPAKAPVQMLFVSIDPARDDPATLGKYTAFFSPSIIAATADDASLQAFTRALGVVYMRAPGGADDNYNMDHTASLLVIDPEARLHALIRPPHAADAIAADLRTLSGG